MKNKLIFLFSFVPILYFGIKVFFGTHPQYYLICFCISTVINLVIILLIKKQIIFQYWLGFIFSFMFLDIVFVKLDFRQFFESWYHLNYYLLIPAVCFAVSSCVAQAYRWRIILSNINVFNIYQLFPFVMIGHLANHILPAKAGEFIKSYYLGKSYKVNEVSIFSTVVIERIFDGIMVLSFLLFFILSLSDVKSELMVMGWIGALIYGVALLITVMIFKFKDRIIVIIRYFLPLKIAGFIEKIVISFADGLQILSNVKKIVHVLGISIIMWCIIAISIVPIQMMFDFQLPFYSCFAILACISLGLSIPSAPGGIGVISFATIFSMTILLKDAGQAVTNIIYAQIVIFSILINVVFVLPEILLGVFFTIKTGSKFSALFNQAISE